MKVLGGAVGVTVGSIVSHVVGQDGSDIVRLDVVDKKTMVLGV
jgi:hypothetical protein